MKMASDAGQPPPVSLMEISRVLEETARLLRQHADQSSRALEPAPGTREAVTGASVRSVIAMRWLRREYLGFEAGDADWSMMLELLAAYLEGRSVSQTRLGVSAGVSQSMALRVTRRMLMRGVFVKRADPNDRRFLLVSLSSTTAERMQAHLASTYGKGGLAA